MKQWHVILVFSIAFVVLLIALCCQFTVFNHTVPNRMVEPFIESNDYLTRLQNAYNNYPFNPKRLERNLDVVRSAVQAYPGFFLSTNKKVTEPRPQADYMNVRNIYESANFACFIGTKSNNQYDALAWNALWALEYFTAQLHFECGFDFGYKLYSTSLTYMQVRHDSLKTHKIPFLIDTDPGCCGGFIDAFVADGVVVQRATIYGAAEDSRFFETLIHEYFHMIQRFTIALGGNPPWSMAHEATANTAKYILTKQHDNLLSTHRLTQGKDITKVGGIYKGYEPYDQSWYFNKLLERKREAGFRMFGRIFCDETLPPNKSILERIELILGMNTMELMSFWAQELARDLAQSGRVNARSTLEESSSQNLLTPSSDRTKVNMEWNAMACILMSDSSPVTIRYADPNTIAAFRAVITRKKTITMTPIPKDSIVAFDAPDMFNFLVLATAKRAASDFPEIYIEQVLERALETVETVPSPAPTTHPSSSVSSPAYPPSTSVSSPVYPSRSTSVSSPSYPPLTLVSSPVYLSSTSVSSPAYLTSTSASSPGLPTPIQTPFNPDYETICSDDE